MAAHAVTGLIQCIDRAQLRRNGDAEEQEKVFQYVRPALDFSCWTEDIDYKHYMAIDRAVKDEDIEALYNALVDALPDTIKLWQDLGRPSMREEWHRAKWEASDVSKE